MGIEKGAKESRRKGSMVAGKQIEQPDITDEELMQKVQRGDRTAFSLVYDRYADQMMRYFYRLLWQDEELAGDMVQDLFLKIIHRPKLYDPGRPFKTWIFSVASNMVKNQYRHATVRKEADAELRYAMPSATAGDEITTGLDLSVFGHSLEQALNELSTKHRDTFVLRYKEGLSVKEVSDAMACSEGTVKSRLYYAVQKLATRLQHFNTVEKPDSIGVVAPSKSNKAS